jgi:hypothetical protein
MPKRLQGVVAGLLIAIGCLGTARAEDPPAPAEAGGAPRVVVENSVVDLGRLVRGEVAKGRFVLRNSGSADLRILGAKPG